MIVNSRRLKTLDEVRAFLAGSSQCEFTVASREYACTSMEESLRPLGYAGPGKADKGLETVTGFSALRPRA